MGDDAGPGLARAVHRAAGDGADVSHRDLPANCDQHDQHDGHANGRPIEILTMLPWTIYITFIGVLALMLLPGGNPRTARLIALVTAVLGLALGLGGIAQHPG